MLYALIFMMGTYKNWKMKDRNLSFGEYKKLMITCMIKFNIIVVIRLCVIA